MPLTSSAMLKSISALSVKFKPRSDALTPFFMVLSLAPDLNVKL